MRASSKDGAPLDACTLHTREVDGPGECYVDANPEQLEELRQRERARIDQMEAERRRSISLRGLHEYQQQRASIVVDYPAPALGVAGLFGFTQRSTHILAAMQRGLS